MLRLDARIAVNRVSESAGSFPSSLARDLPLKVFLQTFSRREMFRLIVTVKRGNADSHRSCPRMPHGISRAAGQELLGHERVVRIMIVVNDVPPRFVECG